MTVNEHASDLRRGMAHRERSSTAWTVTGQVLLDGVAGQMDRLRKARAIFDRYLPQTQTATISYATGTRKSMDQVSDERTWT